MFTGPGFLNLDAEQAPSILVEVSDCLERSFFSRALGFVWTPNCDENESEITRRCV